MPQISNPKNDRRSLTHTFSEVGENNGTLSTNTTGTNSPIISWSCPRKYSSIRYAGGRHASKFTPRYKETFDGDGSTTDFTLTGDVQPVAGETDLDEQPFDAVVAAEDGSEVEVDSIDYATNTVSLASAPATGTANVALYPVICEGVIQYRGLDQFGHEIAPLDEWSTPIHVFSDFNQSKNETEIHLVGAAEWNEAESLSLYLDGPRQIVWEDTEYPRGQYASLIEQRVDVTV